MGRNTRESAKDFIKQWVETGLPLTRHDLKSGSQVKALGFNQEAAQKSLQARGGLREEVGQSGLAIDAGQPQVKWVKKSIGATGR